MCENEDQKNSEYGHFSCSVVTFTQEVLNRRLHFSFFGAFGLWKKHREESKHYHDEYFRSFVAVWMLLFAGVLWKICSGKQLFLNNIYLQKCLWQFLLYKRKLDLADSLYKSCLVRLASACSLRCSLKFANANVITFSSSSYANACRNA